MMMKDLLYRFIRGNKFVMFIYIRVFNKFRGDKIEVEGIQVRHNRIKLSGKKNQVVSGTECSIQNIVFEINGENNHIAIGKNVIFNGTGKRCIYVCGNNNIINIADNCKLTDMSFFIVGDDNVIDISENYSGVAAEFHIEQNNNSIYIGKNTTMHGRGTRTIHFALDEGSKVIIGEDCMFSNDIQIRSSDSHSIVNLERERLNPAEDIIIGNHCWIGLRCIVLKGVNIADNTMVAAGSVCTQKYKDKNVILAGNPAKVVKREVNWDRKFV